jgi:hypothetical protein
MRKYRLDEMVKGWFVGDFHPCALRSDAAEVGVKSYRAGDREESHHHRIATEVTVIISGQAKMNDWRLTDGDIVVVEPMTAIEFCALTDVVTLVVKLPSVPGDKYHGEVP